MFKLIIQSKEAGDLYSYFQNKTVAIIGYDDQGYQHAQRLREFDVEILVVLREGTPNEHWLESGFEIVSVWEAVDRADILQVW